MLYVGMISEGTGKKTGKGKKSRDVGICLVFVCHLELRILDGQSVPTKKKKNERERHMSRVDRNQQANQQIMGCVCVLGTPPS